MARWSIPWYRRFATRVTLLVALIGLASVAAAAYLSRLSTAYLDARLSAALDRAEAAADVVRPFYRAQMDALARSYRARADALYQRARAESWDPSAWERALAAEPDVAYAVLPRPGRPRIETGGPVTPDDRVFVARVPEDGRGETVLEVGFRVDPSIEARFQQVGRARRRLAVERRRAEAYHRGTLRAVSVLVVILVGLAALVGVVLARTVTRRVGVLADTMARIERGEEDVRVPDLGRDEVGRLASALRDMLDALHRARGRLAYLERVGAWQGMARRLAHEIKNPLTPIALAVQQLRDKDPRTDPAFSQTVQTAVEIVEDEVATLRRMVAAFSRFAKLPAVETRTEDLGRILEEFERAYGPVTDEAGDRLVVEGPKTPAAVRADRALLKQVLANLVENAVACARQAGVSPVCVKVACVPDPDPAFVSVAVDDNGPGVPPDRREAVFEPYVTGRRGGTGLGLAIVKKVVLDHGGDVWVEDAPLGGARFVVRLQRAAPEPEAVGQSSSSSRGDR